MRLRSKPESLPARMLSAPGEFGRRAAQHIPLVPDRFKPQPERRNRLAAVALTAGAVAAAGAIAWRILGRNGREEPTGMHEWRDSDYVHSAEPSPDGAAPSMPSSPGEGRVDVTGA